MFLKALPLMLIKKQESDGYYIKKGELLFLVKKNKNLVSETFINKTLEKHLIHPTMGKKGEGKFYSVSDTTKSNNFFLPVHLVKKDKNENFFKYLGDNKITNIYQSSTGIILPPLEISATKKLENVINQGYELNKDEEKYKILKKTIFLNYEFVLQGNNDIQGKTFVSEYFYLRTQKSFNETPMHIGQLYAIIFSEASSNSDRQLAVSMLLIFYHDIYKINNDLNDYQSLTLNKHLHNLSNIYFILKKNKLEIPENNNKILGDEKEEINSRIENAKIFLKIEKENSNFNIEKKVDLIISTHNPFGRIFFNSKDEEKTESFFS